MPLQKPIPVRFNEQATKARVEYVHDKITELKNNLSTLHTQKVDKWRRLYKGVPREKERNFPWKNASNVVIQLIGENVDIIRARVLGTQFEVLPLYVTGLLGSWKPEDKAAEQQEAVHDFLNYVAMEPAELDMYRVQSIHVTETIKNGTNLIVAPWTKDIEAQAIGYSPSGATQFREFTKYEGPRPENVAFECWAATPEALTLESAEFKYYVDKTISKQALLERVQRGMYDKEAVDKIITQPDSFGPDDSEQRKMATQELNPAFGAGPNTARYHIYTCWYPYWHNNKKYRIIESYHYKSKTSLRAIFNFYNNNEEPLEIARFGWTGSGLYGDGLCEMLESYQEEVTTGHNQRVDNRTLANTSIWRVDPDSKLDTIFAAYPNAVWPIEKDMMEKFQLGSVYPSSVEEEQLTIALAKNRAGTNEPGLEAAGAGGPNKKGGQYSSMGTFSVMQAGNRRTNVNITDMRYSHYRLGRKILNQYAQFGIGERGRIFGEKEDILRKALQNVSDGRIVLPIRAASASINKEVEKQNLMLLTQVMQRHHMGVSQILQSLVNPQLPPEMGQFLLGWIRSSSKLMGKLLRSFDMDDLNELLPERKLLEGAANAGQQQQQGQQPRPNGVSAGGITAGAGEQPVPQNSSAQPQSVPPTPVQ